MITAATSGTPAAQVTMVASSASPPLSVLINSADPSRPPSPPGHAEADAARENIGPPPSDSVAIGPPETWSPDAELF
ncbi:hypothetical protein [Nocardia puris]|uniref:hypothetical protein n=1 Tax=Nocardia puris TaxID=208602 RepID=UPI002E240BF4